MKKQPVMIIGGLICLVLILCAFLFPIAPGIVRSNGDVFRGYDFIFTNDAAEITKEASGGMIAAFVLLVIAAVFGAFGTILPLTGSTKFSGFLDIVAGLCLASTAVLFLIAPMIVSLDPVKATYSLGYGFMTAGLVAGVGALIFLVIGFLGMSSKKR